MLSIDPKELNVPALQQILQNAIAPRPIAFASTIDVNGNHNLAPFSFFNVVSSNPPILVFSPAYSGRDGTAKHTLLNARVVPQVVINVVNYNMVQQTSLASSPYKAGVNEFLKAGFTAIKSDLIAPMRVAESPVQFECVVNDIVELGKQGGAGNLIICEIVKIHISKEMLDTNNQIDTTKLDLVARMGGNLYCRANQGLFEIEKPVVTCGIGVDALPLHIQKTNKITKNHLGQLGNLESLPTQLELDLAPVLIENKAYEEAILLLNKNLSKQALAVLIKNT